MHLFPVTLPEKSGENFDIFFIFFFSNGKRKQISGGKSYKENFVQVKMLYHVWLGSPICIFVISNTVLKYTNL
jgi:hypothetical protein